MGNHKATISVVTVGDGSHVTWDVEVEPDEMTDMMQGSTSRASRR